MPDVGYVSQIPDRTKFEEMHILCSLWDLAGSCGVQARIDGGPCKDCSNCGFGGPKECQAFSRDTGTYRILYKVYQMLCSNYCAHGETAEKGHNILLG